MLANALIGLREGLEASLVVSILVAFLVRTERRRELPRVWLGVAVAVAVSVGVVLALTLTEQALTFTAQEALGGSLSIVAVAFVTWMIFWMRRVGRSIKAELQGGLERAISMGPVAVVVMAALAVGREGLETAVFFFAAAQAAGQTTQPLIGFAIGIAVAVLLAYLLYRGAVRLNMARFFTVTGALLVFVAAGILAYGVHDLQEAGILPGLTTLAFDVSAAVPAESWYGTLLKGIFNFSPQTTVLEAVVWCAYVLVVLPLFLRRPRADAPAAPEGAGSAAPGSAAPGSAATGSAVADAR
jgi:high-affinity iron transporter